MTSKADRENRENLIAALARLCPDIAPHIITADIHKLGALGARAHRHTERMCSEEAYYNAHISDDGETDLKESKIEAAAQKIANRYKMRVAIGGDPRGYVMYLHREGLRGNTWGGDDHGFGLN